MSWFTRPLPGAYSRFGDAPSGAVTKPGVDDLQEQTNHTLRKNTGNGSSPPTRPQESARSGDAGTKRVHQYLRDRPIVVELKAGSPITTGD